MKSATGSCRGESCRGQPEDKEKERICHQKWGWGHAGEEMQKTVS